MTKDEPMYRAKLIEVVLDVLSHADYDLGKAMHPDTADDPAEAMAELVRLADIMERGVISAMREQLDRQESGGAR